MNKRQKEVIHEQLTMEKLVLDELEKEYRAALKDINLKIQMYQAMPETQSRIYHKQYQETLKKQIEAALEKLHSDEYTTINEYLHDSYTTGFVGTMYDLHGQGVPIITPIDQNAAIKAVMTDTKLNKPLYTKLGIDVNKLKRTVSSEISRGLASGLSYTDIARNIQFRTNAPLSRAKTIVRTEGHRIQQASTEDARQAAKAKGADVVKQWDATMDGDTRPTHRRLDGQIRETDELFEMDGKKAKYPGEFGDPAEDCNCRCVALTRARSALDKDELKLLRERAVRHSLYMDDPKAYRGEKLPTLKNFKEFKKSYLKAAQTVENAAETPAINFIAAKTIEEAEEYAQRFVPTKKAYKHGDISYAGLGLDSANTLNKVLTEAYDRFDVPEKHGIPLVGNIQTMNFREKQWKSATEGGIAAAYNWGGSGTLFINQKIFANPKTSASFFEKAKNTLQTVLDGADKLLQNTSYSASKRKYIEALVKTKVQTFAQSVNDPIEATIVHEVGHLLEDRLFGGLFKEKGFDAKASMDAYGSKISGYAVTDRHEYIAESFTAFWYGREDIVDPELVAIFKESMR